MGKLIINSADLQTVICNTSFPFASSAGTGRYFVDIEVGPDTGNVVLDYNAASIPDRFQMYHGGVLVADSLYVGNFITGNPPNANRTDWEGGGGFVSFVGTTYNSIPELEWNGTAFVPTGSTIPSIIVQQSDVAPFGQTAGAGQLSFNKTSTTDNIVTIVVTSLSDNTGWDFTLNCPQ